MSTELFYEDEVYRVTVRPGVTSTVVLAFGGIDLALDGISVEEFGRSLQGDNTVFIINEKPRSWWNASDVLELLDDVITAAERALDVRDVAVIGNSMGGSGALLAAHHFDAVTRALALVPQADTRMSNARATRWVEYRERIPQHRSESFALPPKRAELHVVFGAEADHDQRRRFRERGLPVFEVEGYGHSLASRAKREDPAFYRSMIAFVTDAAPIVLPGR